MNKISRILYHLKHGPEVDEAIEHLERKREREECEARANNLNLCRRHQQRSPGTQHAPHNCDYCRALRDIKDLRAMAYGEDDGDA